MPKTIKYVFRMVHIANIPHILKEGFVHSDSPRAAKNYVSIAYCALIESWNLDFDSYSQMDMQMIP